VIEIASSEPSKLTHLTSSVTVPETNTRLTSWGDEDAPLAKFPSSALIFESRHHQRKSTETDIREQVVEEVEREISIHEDRVDPESPQRRRNVTISFSSPVASVIQPSGYEGEDGSERDEDEASQSDNDELGNLSSGSVIITKQGSAQKSTTTKMRTAFRSTSRHISLGGHTFSTRPVSRIDEQDEESFNRHEDDRHRRSISVMVATPIPSRRATSVVLATPRQIDEIGNLSLTPLSEFTMHQGDESFGLDVSYIGGGQRYVLGNNSKRTLSLSIKELVEKITQVEPYEPFWEHMKQIDLKDKRLTNLHKLDEFCAQLEELDASHNQVSQLSGVPRTVRSLRITHNRLSDLAAWGHLSNLQYIDVSNNEIESLSGFRSLFHLRGLRADNNKIKSLDGISQLDGLLNLRVRGNSIESIDFTGSRLQRLTDLDLKDNHICQIRNLHELQTLSNLNLEDNDLSEFSMDTIQAVWTLKYLKLGGNQLEKIDVSRYPNLRLLYLDRNRIGTVSGLLKTKHLDSLSLREQQDGAVIDISFLSEAFEVRKLFLSGNLLTTFQPQVDFLNLQYLELANCGLETLSPEFGHMVANTRVLNLNFNALRDIKPLLGIVRLKKLHLAGNRLSRLRTTTCILSQFSALSFADLRNNPLTLGFYPPLSETRVVLRQDIEYEAPGPEPFTLGKADRVRDTNYAGRLDVETKMLRRVFEILALSGCRRLKTLDGLSVDRSVVDLKDKIWDSLIQAGVLREARDDNVQAGQQKEGEALEEEVETEPNAIENSILSERWHAEDSFA
jgi:protein NUD1